MKLRIGCGSDVRGANAFSLMIFFECESFPLVCLPISPKAPYAGCLDGLFRLVNMNYAESQSF